MTRVPPLILNHVAVPVSDVARSAAFYEDLGLRRGFEKRDPEHGEHLVQFATPDGSFVELIAMSNQVSEARRGHLGFRVDDIDKTHAALCAKGMTPASLPQEGASGVMWFFLSDPDGNLIEFTARTPPP